MKQRPPPASRHALATARGLGWFSIGLGLAQLLVPRLVSRAVGVHDRTALVRACGARELATGVAILAARDPAPGVWARVAGNALDLAVLGTRLDESSPRRRGRIALAIAAVAGVAAMDVLCARALSGRHRRRAAERVRDYRDRSGLPKPPDAMRGAACVDFETPKDMRTPEAMRPYAARPPGAAATA